MPSVSTTDIPHPPNDKEQGRNNASFLSLYLLVSIPRVSMTGRANCLLYQPQTYPILQMIRNRAEAMLRFFFYPCIYSCRYHVSAWWEGLIAFSINHGHTHPPNDNKRGRNNASFLSLYLLLSIPRVSMAGRANCLLYQPQTYPILQMIRNEVETMLRFSIPVCTPVDNTRKHGEASAFSEGNPGIATRLRHATHANIGIQVAALSDT